MPATCSRCSAPVPAAARYCPRCGAGVVASTPGVEQVLFRGKGVAVTDTRVSIGNTVIAAPAVASVAVEQRQNTSSPDAFGSLVGGVILSAVGMGVMDRAGCFGVMLVTAGIWIGLRGIVRGLAHRRWYSLVLTTVSGDRHEATAKRRAGLDAAAAAVTRAMGRR